MKTIKLTYVGRVIGHNGKLLSKYLDDNGSVSLYAKGITPCSIGTIIICNPTADGVKGPYSFDGRHDDQDQVTIWMEQDWANKKEVDLKREIKKVPKTKYNDCIDELNRILWSLPGNQKLLFKMKVFNDLK